MSAWLVHDAERRLADRWLVGDRHARHRRSRRPLPAPVEELIDGIALTFGDDLDAPVAAVAHRTPHTEPTCHLLTRVTVEDALHPPRHDRPTPNITHRDHGQIG